MIEEQKPPTWIPKIQDRKERDWGTVVESQKICCFGVR